MTLHAVSHVRFPAFAGSTLRGAIGRAFRDQVCETGASDCAGCPVWERCGFATAWLGDRPTDAFSAGGPAYLVAAPAWTGRPTWLNPSDSFGFCLHLFGRTGHDPKPWSEAVVAAARTGFSRRRGQMAADFSVVSQGLVELPPLDTRRRDLRLHLATPLLLARSGPDGRERRFEPLAFTRGLLQRLEHLVARHGEGRLPWDRSALLGAAARVRVVEERMQWVEDYRESDRQGRTSAIEGLVGTVKIGGVPAVLQQVWRLAALVHVGRGAAMGLGRVTLADG